MLASVSRRPECFRTRSKHLRMAVNMPSARQSTLRMPSSSRSSLFHWMTVRSGMAAFSMGTSSHSGPAGDDHAAGVLREVAGKADQLLDKATRA